MKFGKYECFSLEMENFKLDGGAMFGAVPKVLWGKKITADKNNLIDMETRSLLIKGKNKNILVDAGIGNKLSYKLKQIYHIKNNVLSVNDRLTKYNLTSNDITDVFITHLHFDHVGGATVFNKNNKIEPSYPNAAYYIQKKQWELALQPSKRDNESFLHENFVPLYEKNVLKLLDGSVDLFEDIEIIVTDGHTLKQQHVLVKDNKNPIFFCADLIPTSAHLPIIWNMAYDNLPLTLFDEKETILNRALNENWILFFQHDPKIAAATIRKGKKNIEIDELKVINAE